MRSHASAMLAGHLAVTIPVTAMVAPGDDFQLDPHAVLLDLTDKDCADGAVLCIIDVDDTCKWTPNGAIVNFTLRNRAAARPHGPQPLFKEAAWHNL